MDDVKIEVSDPPAPPRVEETPKKPLMTTMSWFLADITNAPLEVTDQLWALMVDHARQYLAVGGVPDWKDWRVLDDLQRRAWIEAAGQLKIRDFLDEAGNPT